MPKGTNINSVHDNPSSPSSSTNVKSSLGASTDPTDSDSLSDENDSNNDSDDYETAKVDKEKEEQRQNEVKHIREMRQLSPTTLHMAYELLRQPGSGLAISEEIVFVDCRSIDVEPDAVAHRDGKLFYYEFFDVLHQRKFFLYDPIVVYEQNQKMLQKILEDCKSKIEDLSVAQSQRFIIPLGEAIRSTKEESGHFVTLYLNCTAKKETTGCVFDSKPDPNQQNMMMKFLINSYGLVFRLDLQNFINQTVKKVIGCEVKREYLNTQELSDHNSCAYQTFKVVRGIFEGDLPGPGITAPTVEDCKKLYNQQFLNTKLPVTLLNTGKNGPVKDGSVKQKPASEEHTKTNVVMFDGLGQNQSATAIIPISIDNTYFMDPEERFIASLQPLRAYISHLIDTKMKAHSLEKFIADNPPSPEKTYQSKDYPSPSEISENKWSTFLQMGYAPEAEGSRRQFCIDQCNNMKKLKFEVDKDFSVKKLLSLSFEVYCSITALEVISSKIKKHKKEKDCKDGVELLEQTHAVFKKNIIDVMNTFISSFSKICKLVDEPNVFEIGELKKSIESCYNISLRTKGKNKEESSQSTSVNPLLFSNQKQFSPENNFQRLADNLAEKQALLFSKVQRLKLEQKNINVQIDTMQAASEQRIKDLLAKRELFKIGKPVARS